MYYQTLGGRNIILHFKSVKSMENLLKNRIHGIHHWVKNLRNWSVGFRAEERLTWLKIVGVPLHAWRQDIFSEIGSRWGHTLEFINCVWEETNHLEFGRVLVATSIRTQIDELKNIIIDGLVYRIRIWEEESLLPLKWDEEDTDEYEDVEGTMVSSEWSEGEIGEEDRFVEETQFVGMSDKDREGGKGINGADKDREGGKIPVSDDHRKSVGTIGEHEDRW